MTPAEVLTAGRALAGILPGPAGMFAHAVMSIADAVLSAGESEWRHTASMVHDVVLAYRRSEVMGRDAMRRHWQERAATALAAAATPSAPDTEPGTPYPVEPGR